MTAQILKKLQLLQTLLEREEIEDNVMDNTISKLLDYELQKLRRRQGQLREKLATFEAQYNLKTEEFSRKFKEGKMGDAAGAYPRGGGHGNERIPADAAAPPITGCR